MSSRTKIINMIDKDTDLDELEQVFRERQKRPRIDEILGSSEDQTIINKLTTSPRPTTRNYYPRPTPPD